jgi:hypothetical protein
VAAVQGYQWHVLNASENWITKGIRAEFSGSYVVERSGQELLGAMKMISGSVFMIRAEVLRQHGWQTSITEDWELTLRLYLSGYKVLYTPFIQAPSECVASFKQLARQRMRWAEGHTFNVKKYFMRVMSSPNISLKEKAEFLYFAPYYLQSVFFILGTGSWLVSELLLRYHLPMLSGVGWTLVHQRHVAGPDEPDRTLHGRGVRRNWSGLLSLHPAHLHAGALPEHAAHQGPDLPQEAAGTAPRRWRHHRWSTSWVWASACASCCQTEEEWQGPSTWQAPPGLPGAQLLQRLPSPSAQAGRGMSLGCDRLRPGGRAVAAGHLARSSVRVGCATPSICCTALLDGKA